MSVYFMRHTDSGLIKIGYSVKPELRLSGVRSKAGKNVVLIAQYPGSAQDELQEHKAWAEYRVHGEWFRPDPKLLAYIESLALADNSEAESDPYTARAEEWARYVLDRQAIRSGVTTRDAVPVVSKATGLAYSLLFSLNRRRLVEISAIDYMRLRAVVIAERELELKELQDRLSEVKSATLMGQTFLTDLKVVREALGLPIDGGGA